MVVVCKPSAIISWRGEAEPHISPGILINIISQPPPPKSLHHPLTLSDQEDNKIYTYLPAMSSQLEEEKKQYEEQVRPISKLALLHALTN
jgi:hypothetical protein